MEYWTQPLGQEDTLILAYLAIKLFPILSNSIPDKCKGSAFTKINSSDQSNQNANIIVAMAQVLQHEHQNANSHNMYVDIVMDRVYLGPLQVVACWPSPNWGVAGVIMCCHARINRALWSSGQAGSIPFMTDINTF
jgi:hypothetical protein